MLPQKEENEYLVIGGVYRVGLLPFP